MPNYVSGIQERIRRARRRNRPIVTPLGSSNYLPNNVLRNAGQSMAPALPRTSLRPNYERPGADFLRPSGPPYNPSAIVAPSSGGVLNPPSTVNPLSYQPRPPSPAPTTPAAPNPPAPVGAGVSPYGRPLTGPVPREQWPTILNQNPVLTQQIRDAYLSYYGDIPGGEGTLVGILNKVYNEGYPIERVMQMIRDEGYNVPEMLQQAADLVQLEYGPQETAIERAIAEIQRQLGIDINAQQNYGNIYGAAIGEIYSDLDRQLAGLNAAIPGIWNQASQQGQAAYANALQGIQGGFDQSVQGMQQNAADLGIEAALDETIASLAQSIAPNQQALANEQGSLGQLFSGLSGIYQTSGNRLQGIQAATAAQQRANLLNEVMASIGGLQNQATGAVLEQRGLLSDLAANRGAATRDAYRELEQLGYDRARQEALDRLSEQLALHGMSIQDAQLGIQQGQFVLEQGRFALEQAAHTGQMALIQAQVDQIYAQIRSLGVNDTIAQSLLGPQIEAILSQNGVNQAQITQIMAQAGLIAAQTAGTAAQTGQTIATTSQINAQTAGLLQELMNPGSTGAGAEGTGTRALNDYFTSINAPPDFRTGVNSILLTAETQGYGDPTNPNPDVTAYNFAIQRVENQFQYAPPGAVVFGGTKEQYLNAVRAYFQR